MKIIVEVEGKNYSCDITKDGESFVVYGGSGKQLDSFVTLEEAVLFAAGILPSEWHDYPWLGINQSEV